MRYLADVGWCIQGQDASEFTLLLLDGTRLHIESPSDAVTCHVRFMLPGDAEGQRYPIDRRLPADVKQRLLFFPRFIKLFQQVSADE